MSNNNFFKVITASAGTGKTYRLSLEYIRILLEYSKYEEFNFQQILAITFTRKATVEIKERIYKHLKILSANDGSKDFIEIKSNLESLFGIILDADAIERIRKIYTGMMKNKQDVRIATIDSFTGNIFKSVIAPWQGINEFEIDQQFNKTIIPEVFEALLQAGKVSQDIIQTMNAEMKIRPEDHTDILERLISNRWQFEFLKNYNFSLDRDDYEESYSDYVAVLSEYINSFQVFLSRKDVQIVDQHVKKEVYNEINQSIPVDFCRDLSALWTNADYLKANFGIVLKNIKFFDGRRIRDAELKELAEQTLTALSDFLYYHVYLNEWIELKNFWGELLAEYDKRKLMTGRLTYSDISDYTYINMYDPEISIINPENGIVTNRFYEFLSYRTRFLLIDEFQDTSVIQFKVFQPMIEELLSGDGVYPYGGVIIVGDEKQAIYQWRSGERDLILKLENQYQTEQSKLDTCFRSSRNVMDFINVLFQSEKIQQYAKENDFEWIYDGDVICHRNDTPGCVKLRDFAYGSGEDDGDKRDIYPDFVDEFLIPNLTDKNGVFNCANTAVIARTNKELNSIASVLTLKGIPFVQESNNSLFHHEAIKPILFLMDYIIYRDRLSLLKFYRSAVYLISNTDMKMYMQNNIRLSDEEFESYLDGLPGMDKVRSLNEFYNSPMLFITKAFEAFNFLSIFETENEKKNLDKFLSIASSFEKERHEFSRNIAGFLLYCKEMEKEEGNVQETVTGDDAVTLISVHKSKGLAFCNVFAFNILGEAGGRGAGLIMNYRFDEVYRNLDGYDISLRCKEILKHTTKTDVISRMESSERMQELNTIYVALTRAEDNLFLYYAKKIKKDGEIGAGGETGRIVYESAKEILTDHQYEISEPCFNDKQDSQITTGSQVPDLKGYFLTDHRSLIEEIPEKERMSESELKAVYLTSRKNVIGSIVHYYLSYLPYDEPHYHEYALKQTISRFGNLLPLAKLKEYIIAAIKFTETRSDIFSREWVKIFNEYTIFDPETKKEYRIDRLQIKDDLILIVDYKTGKITDKEQLDRYKTIVSGLDYVKKGKYRIETEYITLELTGISEE